MSSLYIEIVEKIYYYKIDNVNCITFKCMNLFFTILLDDIIAILNRLLDDETCFTCIFDAIFLQDSFLVSDNNNTPLHHIR